MSARMPKLCLHRASGQAYVTDPRTSKELYLGKLGSVEAAAGYDAFCRELVAWREAGSPPSVVPGSLKAASAAPLSVAALCLQFMDHSERYYVKHGKPTSEVRSAREVIRELNAMFGTLSAAASGSNCGPSAAATGR